MSASYNATEQMVVCGAREIKDNEVVYIGVGMPMLATWLAKFTHAPNLTAAYEVGIIRSEPCPLGHALDSLPVQTRANMLSNFFEVNCMAANGHFHKGFVGAGQVDRYGNVNSTVVGDYDNPTFRWPGSGGANDIASMCKDVVLILKQSKRRFPANVDFITSPGFIAGGPDGRSKVGLSDHTGPSKIITDLGIYGIEDGELVLLSYHKDLGVTLDDIRANIGWDIKISANLQETEPPSEEYLRVLREEVDPFGVYRDGKPKVR